MAANCLHLPAVHQLAFRLPGPENGYHCQLLDSLADAAHNDRLNLAKFVAVGLENYPTLRAMMEMCTSSQVTSRIISCLILALVPVCVPYAHYSSFLIANRRDSGSGDAGVYLQMTLDLTLTLRWPCVQVESLEEQQSLESESMLSAAPGKQLITEQNSWLLSTITSLAPHGPLRRPLSR